MKFQFLQRSSERFRIGLRPGRLIPVDFITIRNTQAAAGINVFDLGPSERSRRINSATRSMAAAKAKHQ